MAERFHSITVKELIELLKDEEPDAVVCFTADYGDYHHTQQALPIFGQLEEHEMVEENAYSHSGWALVGEPDDEEDEEEAKEQGRIVLVIR